MNSRDAEWIRSTLDQYEKPLTRYAATITGDVERGPDRNGYRHEFIGLIHRALSIPRP